MEVVSAKRNRVAEVSGVFACLKQTISQPQGFHFVLPLPSALSGFSGPDMLTWRSVLVDTRRVNTPPD